MTNKAVCDLDSADMTPDHWLLLARTIREEYEQYDGFVICHGTDTLAYTSAGFTAGSIRIPCWIDKDGAAFGRAVSKYRTSESIKSSQTAES